MKKFVCSNNSEHVFDTKTQDGWCPRKECYGLGILEEIEDLPSVISNKIGIAILLCDVSGSMETEAFKDNALSKIELVTKAATAGISDYYKLYNPNPDFPSESAYICVIAFAKNAEILRDNIGKPFIKSISQIEREYPSREDLFRFLFDSFTIKNNLDRGYTNITLGLELAFELFNSYLEGSLSNYGLGGNFSPLTQSVLFKKNNTLELIPNSRVLIYSDGAHNPHDDTPFSNPFGEMSASPLITVFFGDTDSLNPEDKIGAEQMRKIANTCPTHLRDGYFLINTPSRYAILRKIYRMASGASGFCPECLSKLPDKRENVV